MSHHLDPKKCKSRFEAATLVISQALPSSFIGILFMVILLVLVYYIFVPLQR